MDNQKLANLLFPDAKDVSYWENKFPRRNLNKTQEVTRYAPSPTGFMHLGNFFQMFISYNLAKNSNGIFIKRLEDTDAKREKKMHLKLLNKLWINLEFFQMNIKKKGRSLLGIMAHTSKLFERTFMFPMQRTLLRKEKHFRVLSCKRRKRGNF